MSHQAQIAFELENMSEEVSRADVVAACQELDDLQMQLKKLDNLITAYDQNLPAFTIEIPVQEKKQRRLILPEYHNNYGFARTRAANIIGRIYRDLKQEPSIVYREAGLVAASEKTIKLLTRINEIKERFQGYVASISQSRFIRKKVLRQSFGDLHLMQTYRKIVILDYKPRTITFYWNKHGKGITRVLCRDVIRDIKELQAKAPPQDEDSKMWHLSLEMSRKKLSSISPNEWLARREPVAPNPKAQIYRGDDAPDTKSASLPIFYLHEHGELPPIEPLGVMDIRTRRAIRRDSRIDPTPLCNALNIYRYKEEFRTLDDGTGDHDSDTDNDEIE